MSSEKLILVVKEADWKKHPYKVWCKPVTDKELKQAIIEKPILALEAAVEVLRKGGNVNYVADHLQELLDLPNEAWNIKKTRSQEYG